MLFDKVNIGVQVNDSYDSGEGGAIYKLSFIGYNDKNQIIFPENKEGEKKVIEFGEVWDADMMAQIKTPYYLLGNYKNKKGEDLGYTAPSEDQCSYVCYKGDPDKGNLSYMSHILIFNQYINGRLDQMKRGCWDTLDGNISKTPLDLRSKYPDGVYSFKFNAEDISENISTSKASENKVVVDNFVPFIKQIIITDPSTKEILYQANWKPRDGAISTIYYDIIVPPDRTKMCNAAKIKFEIQFSETMKPDSFFSLQFVQIGFNGSESVANIADDNFQNLNGIYTFEPLNNPFASLKGKLSDKSWAIQIGSRTIKGITQPQIQDMAGNVLDCDPYTLARHHRQYISDKNPKGWDSDYEPDGNMNPNSKNIYHYRIPLGGFVKKIAIQEDGWGVNLKIFNDAKTYSSEIDATSKFAYYYLSSILYSKNNDKGYLGILSKNDYKAVGGKNANFSIVLDHPVSSSAKLKVVLIKGSQKIELAPVTSRFDNIVLYEPSISFDKLLTGSDKTDLDTYFQVTSSYFMIAQPLLKKMFRTVAENALLNDLTYQYNLYRGKKDNILKYQYFMQIYLNENPSDGQPGTLIFDNSISKELPLGLAYAEQPASMKCMSQHSYEYNVTTSGSYAINERLTHVIVPFGMNIVDISTQANVTFGPDAKGKYYVASPVDKEGYVNGWTNVGQTNWQWEGMVDFGENWVSNANCYMPVKINTLDLADQSLKDETQQIVYDTHAPTISLKSSLEDAVQNLVDGKPANINFNITDNISDVLGINFAIKNDEGGEILKYNFKFNYRTGQFFASDADVNAVGVADATKLGLPFGVALDPDTKKYRLVFNWDGKDFAGDALQLLKSAKICIELTDEAGNKFNNIDLNLDLKNLFDKYSKEVLDYFKKQANRIIFVNTVLPEGSLAFSVIKDYLASYGIDFKVVTPGAGGNKQWKVNDESIINDLRAQINDFVRNDGEKAILLGFGTGDAVARAYLSKYSKTDKKILQMIEIGAARNGINSIAITPQNFALYSMISPILPYIDSIPGLNKVFSQFSPGGETVSGMIQKAVRNDQAINPLNLIGLILGRQSDVMAMQNGSSFMNQINSYDPEADGVSTSGIKSQLSGRIL